ncbi:uncharacterized protein LOC132385174 isoform X3 [Hypanus sabinus]|uniref:uncharacterized protein LOC132385174 isoform X3 n=1 Tax=Hypanus sabinus TaxID=79690 RepID=UPI0028C4621E|nr:uncharacterized protein LOC132385174 isoform X3 [Hypanus sabinus]
MQFSKILVFIVVGAAFLLFGSTSTKATFKKTSNNILMICKSPPWITSLTNSSVKEFTCDSEKYFIFINTMKIFVKPTGIFGLVIASVISTIFISIAVYSLSSQNKPRTYQASDRHPLMRNDANEAVYSHLNQDGQSHYSQLVKNRVR